MIFWDNLKIQNNNVTITAAASSTGSGASIVPVLDLGSAALKTSNLILPQGVALPSGTTFEGPVILPDGSAFNGSVTLPSGSGISGILSSDQLTVPSATLTGALSANEISAASATISGSLIVNGAVSLPSDTTIGGSRLRPGPRQVNLLYVDGHFAQGDDWVSIKNLSIAPVYIYIQLYRDSAYNTPYLIDNHPVIYYTSTPIGPGQDIRVLSFADPSDQFQAINGYVRIKYSTTNEITDANSGNDVNEKVRANDLTGANSKYITYGPNSNDPAPWLRTVLYEDENEYWYVVSCESSAMFSNMKQTMSAAPYSCHYILHNSSIGWRSISAQTDILWGGVIGFKK